MSVRFLYGNSKNIVRSERKMEGVTENKMDFEQYLKSFLKKKKVDLKPIPKDCLDFLKKRLPKKEFNGVKGLLYGEINFSDEDFLKFLREFGDSKMKYYFGLASPSLSFVLIDERLRHKEPMIIHEIIEKIKKDHKEALVFELYYVEEKKYSRL